MVDVDQNSILDYCSATPIHLLVHNCTGRSLHLAIVKSKEIYDIAKASFEIVVTILCAIYELVKFTRKTKDKLPVAGAEMI